MMNKGQSRYTAPLQIVLMIAIIVATIVAGFLMFPSSQEQRDELLAQLGTTNHGSFLAPAVSIDNLPMNVPGGDIWLWNSHTPKWRLLIPVTSGCGEACQQLLYISRQVHVRLAKNSHRFERLLVNLGGPLDDEFKQDLEKEHPYLETVDSDPAAFANWLAETNLDWQSEQDIAILVDPMGRAMMFYTPAIGGNDMLEDLNHLLKYSAD